MGRACASTRTFSNPPIATSASLAPFSMPATRADIATRLATPRMMPSIVRNERNLCAQISRSPVWIVITSWAEVGRSTSACLRDSGNGLMAGTSLLLLVLVIVIVIEQRENQIEDEDE